MGAFNNNGLTMKGANIVASLVAGDTLTFTRIAVGDGVLPSGQTVLTTENMVNPLFDVPISSVERNNQAQAIVKGAFTNATLSVGFYYRELGLFAINPENGAEELFCYGNAGTTADWINPAGESSLIEKEIHLVTLIGNATNVSAVFNENAKVLKSEYDAAMKLKADLDATPENGGRVLAEQMRFDASQTLYVDAAAAAGGDGTEAAPFKTITEAINARYMGAAVIYIKIKPGTYAEKISVPRSPGTTWRFEREGTGTVSIQGLIADNAAYVVLDFLTFDAPANSTEECVLVVNCPHTSFSNVTINGNNNMTGVNISAGRARFFNTILNNCGIGIAAVNGSNLVLKTTSGTGNIRGLHSDGSSIIITDDNVLGATTPYERVNGGVISPASWGIISDGTTDVTTLPNGIYTVKNGKTTQGMPFDADGTLIVDKQTGTPHLIFFYDIGDTVYHKTYTGGVWNDWREYHPQTPTATAETYGLMRVAAVEDETDCQCADAAITPANLYDLNDYRKANVSYAVGAIVGVPYHANLFMVCITAGQTDSNALDTTTAYDGQQIIDGGVTWEVGVYGKEPGDIKQSASNETEDGYLLCNGAAVSRTTYSRLFRKIGTTYGEGDGSTTFNLPNYNNNSFLEGSDTAGTVKSAGLPDIQGAIDPLTDGIGNFDPSATGAFAVTNTGVGWQAGDRTNMGRNRIDFKASQYNSVYGNSNTVQPKSVTVKFCIKY